MVRLWLKKENLDYRIISGLDRVGLSRESLESYVLRRRNGQLSLKGLIVCCFEYNDTLSGFLGGNALRKDFIVSRVRKARLRKRRIKPYIKISNSSLVPRKRVLSGGILLAYNEDLAEITRFDNSKNYIPLPLERYDNFIYSVFNTFDDKILKNKLRRVYRPLILISRWDDFP